VDLGDPLWCACLGSVGFVLPRPQSESHPKTGFEGEKRMKRVHSTSQRGIHICRISLFVFKDVVFGTPAPGLGPSASHV